ncbi:MAG: transglutaminase domain-containing protein, partial [Hydrogenophilaceae bacterium]|nr:transglutaminase domain-containing protein [Hydrogenophilaceae bacterium]
MQMQQAVKSGKIVKGGKALKAGKAVVPHAPRPAAPESLAAKQSRLLAQIHDLLKELEPESAYAAPPAGSEKDMVTRAIGPDLRIKTERGKTAKPAIDRVAKLKALKARQAQLAQLAPAIDADFDTVRQHLLDNKLPAELLLRHDAAVRDYHERRAEYDRLMQALLDADASKTDLSAPLKQLAAFMAAHPSQKSHTPTDPNKLPFGTPKAKVRAPIETEQGFKQGLFNPRKLHGWQPYTLAAAGSLSGIVLPGATVSQTPTAADLAETEDVPLTPAIRAQAAALNNNPVQIHNWVRNSIEFIPSYGSIQGAELTLQSKRGNAFDTASLEIALLRAAGIPARYAYGTVQLPADQ